MKKFLVAVVAGLASLSLTTPARAGSVADTYHWTPIFTTSAPPERVDPDVLARMAAGGQTIPFWRSSVKSPLNGKRYNYEMVGTSPFARPATTSIGYVPIVLVVKFPGGTLDPTQPGCNDTRSVADRFFGSPLFEPVAIASNGTRVGPAQVTDAFQRANWWKVIKGSPYYHVKLKPALGKPVVVTIDAPPGSHVFPGACAGSGHSLGVIPIAKFGNILGALIAKYSSPNQLPIISTYNVVLSIGTQCCVIGFHGAYARSGGEQTYSYGAYTDGGIFNGLQDIGAWSHEIGEWMDDPFVQTDAYNFTPSWGHTGQVSSCQNNLENGDPLTGTQYAITSKGFTYHPQELVFFSWFYRVPPTGTGDKYSFLGTFSSAQKSCF